MSILVLELAGLGFVRETLIFKSWNISYLIGYKYRPLQGEMSNVLLFLKQWREALGTKSPNFPIFSTEIPYSVYVVSLNILLLSASNFILWHPRLSSFQQHRSY